MGYLYLLVWAAFALAYCALMALPVLALATFGRVGAAAGVVLMGFAARWLAGAMHEVWATDKVSLAFLHFLVGTAWALHRATRIAPTAAPDWDRASRPRPLRDLARSPLGARRRMDGNLLALMLLVVPATVVLNYAGEYLQRTALGHQTDYLALDVSWDFARYFDSGPLGLGVILLLGGLLYEGVLFRLPPASSSAESDRRAMMLLPLMLVPWLVIGVTRVFTVHSVALAQGIAIYFFLVRRFPQLADGASPVVAAAAPDEHAAAHRAAVLRRRRWALGGGALGGAVAAFALAGSGLTDSDALAIVAEQMFFLGVPLSVPLRAMITQGGDMRWDTPLRVVSFVLAAPVANGALIGWVVARVLEAVRPGGERRASQPRAATDS